MSYLRLLVPLCFGVLSLCACAPLRTAAPSSSPTPRALPDPTLPDFNSRLGSNRLAAEAASAMGRRLYSDGEYWEVYVRTTPVTLPGQYDPGNPEGSRSAATMVTAAEVVMATESGQAIKVFSQGGDAHERQVMTDLDGVLRTWFPNLASDNIRIFYGESLQHAVAVFDHGKLVSYDVRKVG